MALAEHNAVRVAVEGCGHGTLNAIYASVQKACQFKEWSGVDVVIIGGDFQAVRNGLDLNCMAVPLKYRGIGDFHEYYSGKRVAPYLTIFIGGNHEASNHLFELYYGGWVAPNIYYMGAANVLRLGPLRIAGLSGIWKGYNYKKPHFERLPYNQDDVRSIYHVRELDVRKLSQVRSQVDVGLSHDWPRGIELFGNSVRLFSRKPDFRQESRDGTLGSVAAKVVLDRLKPRYWFSAHLHIKFPALVDHEKERSAKAMQSGSTQDREVSSRETPTADPVHNDAEIDLDLDDDEEDHSLHAAAETGATEAEHNLDLHDDLKAKEISPKPFQSADVVSDELRAQLPASFAKPAPGDGNASEVETPTTITNTITHFLALDKCLPHRDFLQLLEVFPIDPASASTSESRESPLRLHYDPEWLAITRVFASHVNLGNESARTPPNLGRAHYLPLIEAEEAWVQQHVVEAGKLAVPFNFSLTAPIHENSQQLPVDPHAMPQEYSNPQTETFCDLVGIPNPFKLSEEEALIRKDMIPAPSASRGGGGFRGGGRGGRGRGGRGRGHRGGGFSGRGRGFQGHGGRGRGH